jgi:hypothetical protein
MPHTTSIIVRSTLAALSLGVLGCGSELVLPDSPGSAAQELALTKVDGDGQNGLVGERLQNPLVVRVLDAEQHAITGKSVTFELSDPAGGTIDPDTATTNGDGEAVSQWTLGTVPGTYTVIAKLVGAEGEDKVAEFRAEADPGAPASLTALSPVLQPGGRGRAVATPPVVQVLDRFGNPVPDVLVTWQVIAGGGAATPLTPVSDLEGKASVEWTLGDRIGIHKLTAGVEGAGTPVVFEARILF